MKKCVKTIYCFNLFKSRNAHSEREIRNEFLSTRVYIILLTASLFLFTEYYLLATSTQTVVIHSPTLAEIQNQSKRVNNLVCPCSQSSIPYTNFLTFQYAEHQSCSSDFVGPYFQGYLSLVDDKRVQQLRTSFQLLGRLCQLAQNTIENQLGQLRTRMLSQKLIINQNTLDSQANLFVNRQIISATQAKLWNVLQTVRGMTVLNDFLTATDIHGPSFLLLHIAWTDAFLPFKKYCSNTSDYYFQHINITITLDGFFTNCYVVESLLGGATLAPFFNQTIVDQLWSAIHIHSNLNGSLQLRALEASSLQKFKINTTIETIVYELFLENWTATIDYRTYFQQCAPSTCSYTYEGIQPFLTIVLAIIGLVGGVTKIFRGFVPLAVSLVSKLSRKWKIRNNVTNESELFMHCFYSNLIHRRYISKSRL